MQSACEHWLFSDRAAVLSVSTRFLFSRNTFPMGSGRVRGPAKCQPEAIAKYRPRWVMVGHRGAIACDEAWLTHTVARPSHPFHGPPCGLTSKRVDTRGLRRSNRRQKYPSNHGEPGGGRIPVGFREETAGRTRAQGIAGAKTTFGFGFHLVPTSPFVHGWAQWCGLRSERACVAPQKLGVIFRDGAAIATNRIREGPFHYWPVRD